MAEVHRLSETEFNELAMQIVRGDVYVAQEEEPLRISFGHLFALMEPPPAEDWVASLGAVYEEMSKAAPRSINGLPFFFSMKVVHKDDLPALGERVEAKRQALEEA